MKANHRWQRRSVLLAGIGLAGASLFNIARRGRDQSGSVNTTASLQSQEQSMDNARPLKLGWSPWADAEVVSLMASQLIQSRLNVPVERVMADIGIQYESVARGDLDLMLMAWLPGTHRDYWSRIRDRVLDLGPMYSGRLGWIVPDYVPETVLNSCLLYTSPSPRDCT